MIFYTEIVLNLSKLTTMLYTSLQMDVISLNSVTIDDNEWLLCATIEFVKSFKHNFIIHQHVG